MKDVYKNPVLYYMLAPAVIALWPLLVWAVYLPKTEKNWKTLKNRHINSQVEIAEILKLDPERLEFAGSADKEVEFDYVRAVEKAANKHGIPPTNYKLSSGVITRPSGGQESQSARIALTDVDITIFAQFLSDLQLRWANLQCTQIQLKKQKNSPDSWEVDLDFKYYY
ncbi:hypothetical protein ACFL1G_04035 [Planctomycetota bacterium]